MKSILNICFRDFQITGKFTPRSHLIYQVNVFSYRFRKATENPTSTPENTNVRTWGSFPCPLTTAFPLDYFAGKQKILTMPGKVECPLGPLALQRASWAFTLKMKPQVPLLALGTHTSQPLSMASPASPGLCV
jgi:hypothetical protein